MKITQKSFYQACENIIDISQSNAIWKKLENDPQNGSSFSLANIMYYFGAMIIIASMSWLMGLGWNIFGSEGTAIISLSYALGFIYLGRKLWYRENMKIPGGVLFTAAVCMTPLFTFSIQHSLGLWTGDDPSVYKGFYRYIKSGWLFMEISTIFAGLLMLRYIKFPFITMPIAFVLWYMSMDIVPLILGYDKVSYFSSEMWDLRRYVSVVFGAVMILTTLLIDRRTKEDFAFWGYLFGTIIFWFGLTLLKSDSELGKFIYAMINLFMMFLSIYLNRKIFIIFGCIGVFGYLGHLSLSVFRFSMLTPFILTIFGLMIIYLAIQYQKNQKKIDEKVLSVLPKWLEELRPVHRIDNIPVA